MCLTGAIHSFLNPLEINNNTPDLVLGILELVALISFNVFKLYCNMEDVI